MSYRRRHRWFRRMALGLAFASVIFAGRASVAAAKFDEGTDGSRYISAGGWSGLVDMESGIPLSAGIPHGDEPFLAEQEVQVIPYLSHGMLTQQDVQAAAAEAIHDPYVVESQISPSGDEIAFANAVTADEPASTTQSTVIQYQSPGVLGEAVKTAAPARFVAGVTDFPYVSQETQAPADRVERALEQGPQVIPYLSHGMTSDDVVGARPDDRADRFAHSDVVSRPQLASGGGSGFEWNDGLTVGIGALVLALGLGLALGYLRRPRLAGL